MTDAPGRTDTRARLAAAVVMLDRLLHELKQPLNLVRVVAQDVSLDAKKGRLDPDSIPQSMDEIIEAVDQLVICINRLRAFARPGRSDPVQQPMSVEQACRAAVQRIRESAPEAGVEAQFEADLPPVHGDPASLEQAVWELLDNALRASRHAPSGEPRAVLSVRRCDGAVVVTVSDPGGGVPEQVRSRMFEPFCSSRAEAGGLGLALAAALVRDLSGSLELSESGDQGSVLEIRLPPAQ
jgi:signal transduction histidine kinase